MKLKLKFLFIFLFSIITTNAFSVCEPDFKMPEIPLVSEENENFRINTETDNQLNFAIELLTG